MSNITAGTMKAARELLRVTARGELLWNHKGVDTVAEIIERETGCAGMLEALQLALVSVQEGKRKFAETSDVMWCDAEDVIVAAIRRARGE